MGIAVTGQAGSGGGGAAGVISFNTRTGAVTLLDSDVLDALGFTPADVNDVVLLTTNQSIDGIKTWLGIQLQNYLVQMAPGVNLKFLNDIGTAGLSVTTDGADAGNQEAVLKQSGGVIAYESDIPPAGVPYTGATADLELGNHNFKSVQDLNNQSWVLPTGIANWGGAFNCIPVWGSPDRVGMNGADGYVMQYGQKVFSIVKNTFNMFYGANDTPGSLTVSKPVTLYTDPNQYEIYWPSDNGTVALQNRVANVAASTLQTDNADADFVYSNTLPASVTPFRVTVGVTSRNNVAGVIACTIEATDGSSNVNTIPAFTLTPVGAFGTASFVGMVNAKTATDIVTSFNITAGAMDYDYAVTIERMDNYL